MKNLALFFMALIIGYASHAQPSSSNRVVVTQQLGFPVSGNMPISGMTPTGPPLIKFRNISIKEAIQEAAVTGKMVFAQFIVTGCDRCNETADAAFASESLAAAVAEKCVPIKINVNGADRIDFVKKYNPSNQLGTFFISANGDLLSHYARTSSRASDYISELETAYSKQTTEGRVTLKELDEEWKASPQNYVAMELGLQRRQSFGWQTDSLLEVYVARLPKDSLQSVRTLGFIATMAPSLFSGANNTLRRNQNLFHQVWLGLPEVKRVEINRRVINKSLNKAISSKNIRLAEEVARFTKATYIGGQSLIAQQGYDRLMVDYFKGIEDTATYLVKAVAYYDQYYMASDSRLILSIDSINRKKALDTAKSVSIEDPRNKGKFITTRMIPVASEGNRIAAELMQGVNSIYAVTNDVNYLQKITPWVTKARELSFVADMDGMLPRLLYEQGKKAEAIALQKELILKLQQVRRPGADIQQATLKLMEADKKLSNRTL